MSIYHSKSHRSYKIAQDMLDIVISRAIDRKVTNNDVLDISEFAFRKLDESVKCFSDMISIKIVAKPIFYAEVEPAVGTKDRMSRFSVKLISVDKADSARHRLTKISGKTTPRVDEIVKRKTTRSFFIRSSTNKSASRDQNRSVDVQKSKVQSTRGVRLRTIAKEAATQMGQSQLKTSRPRKRTPEMEYKVLDKETKHMISQFKFFYSRPESKNTVSSVGSKYSEFVPTLNKLAGICSLDNDIVPSDNPYNEVRNSVPARERLLMARKLLDRMPTESKGSVADEPQKVNRAMTGNNIKVFNQEKLRNLFMLKNKR